MSDLKIKVLGFFTKYIKDPVTGERNKAVDWVRYSPGQALNSQITEKRVETMRPKDADDDDDGSSPNAQTKRMHMQARWSVVGPAYEAWKKGYAIPEQGTALAAWSGITKDQADALRRISILTVEDLASLDDNKLLRVPMPNAREVRDLARAFLSSGDATKFADRMTAMEKQNAALQEQLAAAMELLEEKAKPKRKAEEKEAA